MRGSTSLLTMLLAASLAWAAPPTLTAPTEVTGDVSAFVTVQAVATGSKWIRYQPIDGGLSVFPSHLLADKTVTVVVAAKEGRYRVLAYAGNDEGGVDAVVTVVIGKPKPAPTDPPTNPPVNPPAPNPTVKATFLIVRKNGPADRSLIDILANPAWDELVKAGHKVKEMTLDEAITAGFSPQLPQGTSIPCVVPLEERPTGSRLLSPVVALPTTTEGIRDLAKGVK